MRLEWVVSQGGREARLRVYDFEAKACQAEFPDLAALRSSAEKWGCAPECLDDSALEQVHGLLTRASLEGGPERLDQISDLIVARSLPAQAEQVEGLRFVKPYLSAPEDLALLKSKLFQEGWRCLETGTSSDYVVDKGARILGYLSIQPGKPGMDVQGEPIPLGPSDKALPQPGAAILAQPQRWTALKKGFLVLEDDILNVLSPPGEGNEVIWVAPDRMSVRLMLRKEGLEDFPPTLDLLKGAIARQGFAFPVSEAKLNQALRAFREGRDQDVALMEGRPASPGRDGRQELLVDPEPDIPDPEREGKVDFKTFTFFRKVRKGDALALIHPHAEGEVGMDVFGTPILPTPPVPFGLLAGKNTERSGTGILTVTAACDGRLTLAQGVPEVIETLKVREDVSLKTGNIDFPGSVEIGGDLRDNMEIRAKGDVDIAGTVEDGSVTSDGAIVVRGGFTGSGKGVIKSKLSSVTIGHIRNQRIESHSNIIVYNEVINAHLYAKKSILMKTLDHSVVGGHLKAYSTIEISNAGGPGGTKTILEVGKDFEVEQELEEKRAQLKEIAADLEFLERISIKLANLVKSGSQATPEMRLLEQRTKGVLQFIRKSHEALAAEIRILEGRAFNPGDCSILVRGTAYPGTMLKHHDRIILVSEVMIGKRWAFRGRSPGS